MFVNSQADKQHTIVKFLVVTLLPGTRLYVLLVPCSLSSPAFAHRIDALQFGSEPRRETSLPPQAHDTNISVNCAYNATAISVELLHAWTNLSLAPAHLDLYRGLIFKNVIKFIIKIFL